MNHEHQLFLPHPNGQSYNQSSPPTIRNQFNISQQPARKRCSDEACSEQPARKRFNGVTNLNDSQSYNESTLSTTRNPPDISQPSACGPVGINPAAISYVVKVKDRFKNQLELYHHFLKMCHHLQDRYIKDMNPLAIQALAEIVKLFENQEDLLWEFAEFLPESAAHALASQLANKESDTEEMRVDPDHVAS